MEYHNEHFHYTTEIKRIYHISDIHINLQAKHEEYKQVFKNLYTFLKDEKKKYNITDNKNIECIVVITGDILHSKTELLPECIELTRSFLTNLSKIMPTIMIAGNHDLNINNSERLDGLTPIKNGVDKDLPLYYFKKSGTYYFSNIIWSLASVQDYLIIEPSLIKSNDKTKICLFHGRVNGAILYNKTKLTGETNKKTNKTITPESFKGYDYVLMGDIHKQQYMNKNKTMAYSGSLIQQNHGETRRGHGVLVWDLENKTSKLVEIKNDFCFFTYKINNDKFTEDDLNKITAPHNMRLRLLLNQTNGCKLQEIIALFKTKFNILEVNYQDISEKDDNNDIKSSITHCITNPEYQNKLIVDYLKRNCNVNENTLLYIQKLNILSNKQLDFNNQYTNTRWKLIKLEFSNLFSYSENNVINFKDYKGILGIIAPNHMGKSAIIDIILFTLYDKFPRKGTIKDIVNNRKKNFKSKITFKIGGWYYVIYKYGNKTDKGRVTTKIDFYRINKENIKEILTEETVVKTKATILKYIGMYEDIIQTNISLQNNNCNFIEAENTARRKELERILQVDFIGELVKKNNTIIMDKRAVYKHLQNNCYEESIIKLKKNITEAVKTINIDSKQLDIINKNMITIEKILNDLIEKYHPNLQNELDLEQIDINNFHKNISFIITSINALEVKKQLEKQLNLKEKNVFEDIKDYDNKMLCLLKQEKYEKHLKYCEEVDIDIAKLDNKIEELLKQKKTLNDNSYDINMKSKNEAKMEKKIIAINKLDDYQIKIKEGNENISNCLQKIMVIQATISNYKQEELPSEMITYLEETALFELNEEIEVFENENSIISKVEEYKEIVETVGVYNYLENYQTLFESKCEEKTELELQLEQLNKQIEATKDNIINMIMNSDFNNSLKRNNDKLEETFIKNIEKEKKRLLDDINKLELWLSNYEDNIKYKKINDDIEVKVTKLKKDKSIKLKERKEDKEYDDFLNVYRIIEQINIINVDISKLEIKRVALLKNKKQYDKYQSQIEENNKIRNEISNYKKELQTMKDESKVLDHSLNISKAEFVRNNTKLEEHKSEIKKMKEIEKELNIYSIYNDALKQLPYIVIKKVTTKLERKINELLAVCTNFMIKIIVDSNHIDIYIDRPVYNGSLILLNNASGFERFISSLAIRLALIHISQLPKPNFIAIDEGWTSFDYQNINNVRIIFDFIVKQFDFVLSISHLSQIKEHCNNQIHLKKNKEGFSKIIV